MNGFYWAILTAFIWGSVPILEKIGLARISPGAGLLLRCAGVAIGLVLLMLARPEHAREALTAGPRPVFFLVGAGLLASFIGQLFFYNALKQSDASKVVPIAGSFPLVAFFLGLIFLSEKFTVAKGFGVALVVAGIAFLR
jgi:bacterial/archaeal transporter family protein